VVPERPAEAAVTHGLQQWAADTTHCLWIRVPPQKWWFLNRMETWYLMERRGTSAPPMILVPDTPRDQQRTRHERSSGPEWAP